MAIAVAVMLAGAPTGASAAVWSHQAPVVPPGASQSALYSADCPSRTDCIGVGSYAEKSVPDLQIPLAEGWNGANWQTETVPSPTGTYGTGLSSVSCTSSTRCVAVGFDINSDFESETMAAELVGAAWSAQTVPKPAGAQASVLEAISCATTTSCTAVGNYTTSSRAEALLIERWNGAAWTLSSAPVPSGFGPSELDGISCRALQPCVAVGDDTTSKGVEYALSETWSGSSWTPANLPSPAGAKWGELSSVSCSEADACSAVGDYGNSAGTELTLGETLIGTTWTLSSTPSSASAKSSELDGVACLDAASCEAVGQSTNSAGTTSALADGSAATWTVQRFGAIPANSYLSRVSCPDRTFCSAVGAAGPKTLIATWNGTAWTQTYPSTLASAALSDVSCLSATVCTAVGGVSPSPAVARLRGTTWTLTTLALPSGASNAELTSVSCVSATACLATGQSSSGALVERLSGTTWTIVKAPSEILTSVACTSATDCQAVGPSGPWLWNGTSWKLEAVSGSDRDTMRSIACRTSARCESVGVGVIEYRGIDGYVARVQGWDGTSWTEQQAPYPYYSVILHSLTSVACGSITRCEAVGIDGGSDSLWAMVLDGTVWTTQPIPNVGETGYYSSGLEDQQQYGLRGTSCSSTSACVAVGSDGDGNGVRRALIERYG